MSSSTTSDYLNELTRDELLSAVKDKLQVPTTARRPKNALIEFILKYCDAPAIHSLVSAGREKWERRLHPTIGKRKREDSPSCRRVSAKRLEERDVSKFLELPDEGEILRCHREFYDRTSNAALRIRVCAICARESTLGDEVDNWKTVPLNSVPNPRRLRPHNPHPAHTLYHGMLLDPVGVRAENGISLVTACSECFSQLTKSADVPPAHSLANNMWIGPPPWELQNLTFPEQLLISLLYPRVFVFKLFPKQGGSSIPEPQLQRAMRGNVSTYELNMDSIADMVEGNLMPRPPAILASIISITFIGMGRLPKKWMHRMFRVRRPVVGAALSWLTVKNKAHYGHVHLSKDRIDGLPEDDVPEEIMETIHESDDTSIIDREEGGYVPLDDDDLGNGMGNTSLPEEGEDEGADVIPLQISGTADTDLTKVTTSDLMTWALQNVWSDGEEGSYAVKHGRQPVNDFGRPRRGNESDDQPARPNYWERAFPILYPYGRGGPEADRPVPVDFRDHIRWSLQYHDRRFRRHETFPFVAFGIVQRREALGSARVQMGRRNFDADAQLMATVTPEKLAEAKRQEERKAPITDPAVRKLREHLQCSSGRVMGSDVNRIRWRSMIWSTSILLYPATAWITINPDDLHDPIAQLFVGEEVDLDSFTAIAGLNSDRRAENIAADPYAAAKFFHFIIQAVLETLFGIKSTTYQVHSRGGIFGRVSAYFGAVESQGRGTLHLHLLLWLLHAPTGEEVRAMLQTEEFRERVCGFIREHLRAYVPGLESAQSVKSLPKESDIAFNRQPNPRSPNYRDECARFETRVVATKQVHTCRPGRCLVPDGKGRLRCKRKEPFQKAAHEFVNSAGEWGPKRCYEFINAWIPALAILLKCNNDFKLLLNGSGTKNISFYVTKYGGKAQGRNHNISAIMSKALVFHNKNPKYGESLKEQQRLLIFRLVHAVNREQELSAPMVMSYLMGWGDVYFSHRYTPVYWSSFVKRLVKTFPDLKSTRNNRRRSPMLTHDENQDDSEPPDSLINESRADDIEKHQENATLDTDVNGQLYPKCQVTDYCLRGEALKDMNLLTFFMDTYDEKTSKNSLEIIEVDPEPTETRRGPGRPKSSRVPYRNGHPSKGKTIRVVRSHGHKNLPNFIGGYFPRSDDEDISEFYCASMLLLLKPWRNVSTDLKAHNQSWIEAFQNFKSSAPKRVHDILANIQHYHECETAAQLEESKEEIPSGHGDDSGWGSDAEGDLGDPMDIDDEPQVIHSEQGLRALQESLVNHAEEDHGRGAVIKAKEAGIFGDIDWSWDLDDESGVGRALGDDYRRLTKWNSQLDKALKRQRAGPNASSSSDSESDSDTEEDDGDVVRMDTDLPVDQPSPRVETIDPESAEEALPSLPPEQLNTEQRRAYDIMLWHLDQTLAGNQEIPPLRMILYGEGGTGKSRVIQSVTEAFENRGAPGLLLKSAYTGIAASLISGKTTHVIGHIAVDSKKQITMSDEVKRKLQAVWKDIKYLIVDEFSMISKSFLATLSRHIGVAKQQCGSPRCDDSFGGISVILCGDLHQFPPVVCSKNDPLFKPTNIAVDKDVSQIGRSIYEEFKTVVILRQQKRITDEVWRLFLQRLRFGRVTEEDLDMLQSLVINKEASTVTNFDDEPWSDAPLVTPRHGVRHQWNSSAQKKHCAGRKRQLYVCNADETVNGRELSLAERYGLYSRGKKTPTGKIRHPKDPLPEKVELSIGAKVLVTKNIQTELDLANGARGEIVDIVLHPDEPDEVVNCTDPIVYLQRPPLYVLIKMERTRASALSGLEEGVIPIEPVTMSMRIQVQKPNGTYVTRTVKRTQLPMTPAYAFTDYRSQGQTIHTVIVDVASPPRTSLNLFNLYVALSRSSGRNTIRLLRSFDRQAFLQPHDSDLLMEDDRLERLDRQTAEWWDRVQ